MIENTKIKQAPIILYISILSCNIQIEIRIAIIVKLLFKFIDDYHFINFIFINEEFEIENSLTEIEFYKKIGFM